MTPLPTYTPATAEAGPIAMSVSQVPRISPQELKEELEAGEDVIIVDTRKFEFYERHHIPDSISIPLSDIEDRLGELPQDKKIVLY